MIERRRFVELDWAENHVISSRQLMSVVYCTVVGFGILNGPNFTLKTSGTGGPLMQLLGAFIVAATITGIIKLLQRHPGLELIGLLRLLMGPFGGLAGLAINLLWVFITAVYLRGFMGVVHTFFVLRTPVWVLILAAVLTAGFFAYNGLETIVRFFQVVLLLEVAFLLPIPFFVIERINPSYLMPFLTIPANPFEGLLAGTAGFIGYASLFIVFRSVRGKQQALGPVLSGFALAAFVIVAFTVGTLGVFGVDGVRQHIFPAVELVQVASLPRAFVFLERFSLIFLLIWIMATLKVLMLAIYVIVQNFQNLFHLKGHPAVHPAVLLAVFTVAVYPTNILRAQDLVRLAGIVEAYLVPALTLVLWLLSLLSASREKRRQGRSKESKSA